MSIVSTVIPLSAQNYNSGVLPLLIASHLANVFLGINFAQFYYVAKLLAARKEPSYFTWAVLAILFACSICDSISKDHFVTVFSKNATIKGLALFVSPLPTSIATFLAADVIIVLTCHLTYIRRILKMLPTVDLVSALSGTRRKSSRLTIIALVSVGILSIAQVPFGVLTIIRLVTKTPDEWFPMLTTVLTGYIAAAALGDVVLCVTFIFNLRRYKAEFIKTNSLIDKWVRLSLECMILPTIIQITRWLLVQIYPRQAYHYPFSFIVTKFYIMSVLVLYGYILKPKSADGAMSSSGAMIGKDGVRRSAVTKREKYMDQVHVMTTIQTHCEEEPSRSIHIDAFQTASIIKSDQDKKSEADEIYP